MAKVEFQRCVVVDGKAYATIEEAQIAILSEVISTNDRQSVWTEREIAQKIVAERDQILAALTLKDDSRPAARKAFGGKKTRKPKTEELPGIEPKAA